MSVPTTTSKATVWQERIREQKESGLSIASWCKANQLSPESFAYWKRRLFRLSRSSFVELKDLSSTHGIRLEYHNIQIHLEKHFDAETLAQVIKILKGLRC